jgi:hypothetical protein
MLKSSSCLLPSNLLLGHDIPVMLISTQMVSLCANCNHSSSCSQIVDLKNFQIYHQQFIPWISLFSTFLNYGWHSENMEPLLSGIHCIKSPSLNITFYNQVHTFLFIPIPIENTQCHTSCSFVHKILGSKTIP